MNDTLTFLVPAFREERTIETLLERVLAVATETVGFQKEIVVCDDGSNDQTAERVRQVAHRDPRVRLVVHAKNQGKGAAVRTALASARGSWVVIQDADLEYDPQNIVPMLALAKAGARAVYGSRFLASRHPQGMQRANWICNKLLTATANVLFQMSITDEATCYKLVRTDVLRSLDLESTGFELCPEITAKLGRRRVRIEEVPIHYSARSVAQGKKIRWTDGVKALSTLLRYRMTPDRAPALLASSPHRAREAQRSTLLFDL
ncbi:MAG: glycosyltransferase family 2 protein [Kofleriaceae bacterium]